MSHGGYHPYPRRFGGGKPQLQVIHESLNQQRGTSFDATNDTTYVWLENMAIARAIYFDGWCTNQRLGHQWDPERTTDMLARWERVFAIRRPLDATDKERRDELTLRWQRFGSLALHGKMLNELQARIGNFLEGIFYIPIAAAVVHVPNGTYPWGTVAAGAPWTSSVAHILVKLRKPTGATEGEFYEMAAKVIPTLDPLVPAWITIDWYREPAIGTPITVGDITGLGFYLDNEHNLDNSLFDA